MDCWNKFSDLVLITNYNNASFGYYDLFGIILCNANTKYSRR
jgi:hypothetical protein